MYPKYKSLGFEVEALRELQPAISARFHQAAANRKGVRFSITYAGKVPLTRDLNETGDGVVVKTSAVWQFVDVSRSDSLEHTTLTGKGISCAWFIRLLALEPKTAK